MPFLRSAQIGRGYDGPETAIYSGVGGPQSVAVGPDGTIFAIVSPHTNTPTSETAVYHSTDQGLTWVRTGNGGPYTTAGLAGQTRCISVSANNVVLVSNSQQVSTSTFVQAGIWNGTSISWGAAANLGFSWDNPPFPAVVVRPHPDSSKRATNDFGILYASGVAASSAYARIWAFDINRTTGAITSLGATNPNARNFRPAMTWDHNGDGLTPRDVDNAKYFVQVAGSSNQTDVLRFRYNAAAGSPPITIEGQNNWTGTGMNFLNASGWCWSDGTASYCRGWDRSDPEKLYIFRNGWDSAMTAEDNEYTITVSELSGSNGIPGFITYRDGLHHVVYGPDTSAGTVRYRTWTPGGGASAVLMSETNKAAYFGGIGGADAVPASAPILASMSPYVASGTAYFRGYVAAEGTADGIDGWGWVPIG